jgi:16S rRNA (guanine527-N7)-methyltransferase
MEPERIAELLQPFLSARELPGPATLSAKQLAFISIYVDLLRRWNARINLTAIRDPEGIVTRHFGESFFMAAYLFPGGGPIEPAPQHALDFGSGAGFPGLPLKVYAPQLRLTLVEAGHKKAAFLGEVIRALRLNDAIVFRGRLDFRQISAPGSGLPAGIQAPSLVTMRAVERFESALATAASLVRYGSAVHGAGSLALLIGQSQAGLVSQIVSDFSWEAHVPIPESRERILLLGRYRSQHGSRR